jgi:hypothetical protein
MSIYNKLVSMLLVFLFLGTYTFSVAGAQHETVHIAEDGTVYINGEIQDAPESSTNVTITHEETTIEIESSEEEIDGDAALVVVTATETPEPTQEPAATIVISKPQGALDDINVVLSGAITLVFIAAGLIAFFYLLLGGIRWVTSGGDSAKVDEARGQIIQALIGVIVVLASWGLLVLIEKATGACFGLSCPIEIPKFYTD